MSVPRQPLLLAAVAAAGCALGGAEDDPRCTGGKCDDAADVRSQLDGLADPIAAWLRESPMTPAGILEADYLAALEEVGHRLGCSLETLKTFVVSDDLVTGEPFPRVVSTLCTDDETRAVDFFIAGSFPDPAAPHDVDPRNLEMFAWDPVQGRYVFYAMLPVPGSDTEVEVEVEPRRCAGCHLNARSLDADGMPMLPIMNELTQPWPHWNAEPDFPSHTFVVPEATRAAPVFRGLTAGSRLGSASQFEQIIRTAQSNRIVAERVKLRRRQPADVGEAMALLRPVFCDEQLNYVTEDHQSSVLPSSAIIAGGTREAFLAVRPTDWPWAWLNDGRIRFSEGSADPLAMIPVRGNVDVEYERRLISVRALDPMDLLRVRSLDWQTPVLSEFRCGLWKAARGRLREAPPEVTPTTRNADLIPILYREIMTHEGESLIPDDPERLVAIADGGQPEVRQVVDLDQFGALLQELADEVQRPGGRGPLRVQRDQRLCVVDDEFPNRPGLPPFLCPNGLAPLGAEASAQPLFDGEGSLTSFEGANHDLRLIPDGAPAGVASSIEASGVGTLAHGQVTVRVAIAHAWRGDLRLILRAPSGEAALVADFDPGDSANDLDELFVVTLPPGARADGAWTLTVIDSRSGVQGFLEGWSLGVNAVAPRLAAEGARVPPGH